MKESGIGTPATRAAIIERLIAVGYIERDGRALVATEKGLNVIRLLDEHALTSPGLTGSWEQRLGKIERGEDSREKFMSDIAGFARGDRQGARRDAQRRAHPARAARPVPGLRARHRREPQGLLVLVARGPRLRVRDLEVQSRQAAAARGRARADQDRLHRAGRHRLPRAQRPQLPRPPRAAARPTRANGASSSTSCGRARAPSRPRSRPSRRAPAPRAPSAGSGPASAAPPEGLRRRCAAAVRPASSAKMRFRQRLGRRSAPHTSSATMSVHFARHLAARRAGRFRLSGDRLAPLALPGLLLGRRQRYERPRGRRRRDRHHE